MNELTIFEIILLKYPNIEGVSYWDTKYDGTPWLDPYDGLVWENTVIPKPSKEDIDLWRKDSSLIDNYTKEQNTIYNKPILLQLEEIDIKSIRALRTNDTQRLADLEQQAIELRTKLLPEE